MEEIFAKVMIGIVKVGIVLALWSVVWFFGVIFVANVSDHKGLFNLLGSGFCFFVTLGIIGYLTIGVIRDETKKESSTPE